MALLGEPDRKRERLGLPGFGEYRPALIAGQPLALGERLGKVWWRSGAFKVVVPHVDIDGIARRGLLAPELARRETDGVDVLPLLAQKVRVGVGEVVDTMVTNDYAHPAARITRQARVPARMDVACAHALAYLEAGSPTRPGLKQSRC